MYLITRVPNPITARASPINSMGIAIEIFQFIYIGITAYIVARQGRIEPKQKEQLRQAFGHKLTTTENESHVFLVRLMTKIRNRTIRSVNHTTLFPTISNFICIL
jgi:hypothetical protein